ncbi:hypothetical protein RYX36_000423 [Vicia faba]
MITRYLLDIILAALNGFNGTAFAYGKTCSGKTFTMNGCETDPGVIPQAVKDIFTIIETMSKGEENMHFGETNMNVRTIRLHTIFRMVIESKGADSNSSIDSSNDIIRVSVLNLVYLAGSERIAKTGADGVRLKEGKYINKSLMILGDVINKLSDGSKQKGHIPYCDSKLTRILKPALGGNSNTSIICTVVLEEQGPKGTLEVIMCGTVSCNGNQDVRIVHPQNLNKRILLALIASSALAGIFIFLLFFFLRRNRKLTISASKSRRT